MRVTVPEAGAATAGAAGEEPPGRDALARRQEILVQQAQVDAAEASVRAAWARLAPQLSVSGAAYVSDVPYPTGKTDGWRVTVDLTWPIWDGGLQLGRRRQAEARRTRRGPPRRPGGSPSCRRCRTPPATSSWPANSSTSPASAGPRRRDRGVRAPQLRGGGGLEPRRDRRERPALTRARTWRRRAPGWRRRSSGSITPSAATRAAEKGMAVRTSRLRRIGRRGASRAAAPGPPRDPAGGVVPALRPHGRGAAPRAAALPRRRALARVGGGGAWRRLVLGTAAAGSSPSSWWSGSAGGGVGSPRAPSRGTSRPASQGSRWSPSRRAASPRRSSTSSAVLGVISGIFVPWPASFVLAVFQIAAAWILAALGLTGAIPDLNLAAFGGGPHLPVPPAWAVTHATVLSLVYVFAAGAGRAMRWSFDRMRAADARRRSRSRSQPHAQRARGAHRALRRDRPRAQEPAREREGARGPARAAARRTGRAAERLGSAPRARWSACSPSSTSS